MEVAWDKWLKKELVRKTEFDYKWLNNSPKRSYLHFDYPISTPKNIQNIKRQITDKDIVSQRAFFPFLRYIDKTPKYKLQEDNTRQFEVKERPIMYAAHFDSLVYSWYATQLESHYEKYLKGKGYNDSVLAYRKIEDSKTGTKFSNINFAKLAFDNIGEYGDGAIAVCLDITGFFDYLNHEKLAESVLEILPDSAMPADWVNIIQHITKHTYVNFEEIISVLSLDSDKPRSANRLCSIRKFRELAKGKKIRMVKNEQEFGIPQGSPISAVLSNVYMSSIDKRIQEIAKENDGKYFRYSDDILLVLPKGKEWSVVLQEITKIIKGSCLTLNKSKTEIIEFYDDSGILNSRSLIDRLGQKSLKYLGFEFDGQHVQIRNSTISGYQAKMKRSIKKVVRAERKKGRKKIRFNILRNKYTSHYTHEPEKLCSFIGYAYRSYHIFKSEKILKQIKNHKKIFNKSIANALKKYSK